jgi:hypothetical protein
MRNPPSAHLTAEPSASNIKGGTIAKPTSGINRLITEGITPPGQSKRSNGFSGRSMSCRIAQSITELSTSQTAETTIQKRKKPRDQFAYRPLGSPLVSPGRFWLGR